MIHVNVTIFYDVSYIEIFFGAITSAVAVYVAWKVFFL